MRDVWEGKVSNARPVTVVQDDANLIALWMAPGTRWYAATKPDGSVARIPLDIKWDHKERVWTGGGVLHLIKPGAAHAIWALWSEGHAQVNGWYVNLQEPIRRTRIGLDYTDHLLDLVVSADLRNWLWKDEGELDEACARNLIKPSKVHAIRAEGERVLAEIKDGRPPFELAWTNWAPDPHWLLPQLPSGWEQILD